MNLLEDFKNALPLIVAIVSASLAFLFTQLQKLSDFRKKRKSVAVGILIEIMETKNGIGSLHVKWETLREKVQDPDYIPLLVLSSDINMLNRVKIEDYKYPPPVVSSTIRFLNSTNELYECIRSVNSDKFNKIGVSARTRIIDMMIIISGQVEKHGQIAVESIKATLPPKWFKDI